MFFNEDGILDIDDLLLENDSFKHIVEDGVITEDEIKSQSDKVVSILQHMEATYAEEQLSEVKGLLTEISALFAAYNLYSIQEINSI